MQTEHQKAMDSAKVQLICRPDSVFISTILFSLQFSWDESISTACTDGKNLRVNPKFFLDMSPSERLFVLAHESYHVAFQHMARVGDRNFRLWNIATDYVINQMLDDSGFIVDGKRFLLDPKYKGMSSYEVYDLIKDLPESQLPPAPDHMEEVTGTPEEIEEIVADITATVSKAAVRAELENQTGTIPGEIKVYLDSLLNPKLPWNRILANLLNEMDREDYTFQRVNRRFFPTHILPSLYSEQLKEIAVAVDVSGSITQKEFDGFISEINSIHNTLRPKTTTVVSFDTQVTEEYVISSQDDIAKLGFKGGGGTLIKPVYDWMNKHKPNAMIIFTDGYFSLQPEDIPKGIPIFWVIHSNTSFKTPVGKVLLYED